MYLGWRGPPTSHQSRPRRNTGVVSATLPVTALDPEIEQERPHRQIPGFGVGESFQGMDQRRGISSKVLKESAAQSDQWKLVVSFRFA